MFAVIPWLDQGIQKGYAGFIILDSRFRNNDILRDNVMTKQKQLIWVYPQNNWISNFSKTFIYGWCDPKAKLFVSVETLQATFLQPVKIFPNGNFAQTIKLSGKKNIVKLIQILNGKEKIITRNVMVKINVGVCCNKPLQTKNLNPPISRNNPVIVIDPGHGGKEHGTHSPRGIAEKHFNLQIAKMLYKKLRRGMPRYAHGKNLYLTRSTDQFVSLKDRINFGKKKKCNLFISIHHNALPDNENPLKHRGVGIYYTHDSIKPFVKKLLENIAKESGLKQYGIFKRDFAVTRPDFYTGVLIECGFLIHPEESEYLTKRETQEKIVRGIIKATNTFYL